MKKELPEYMVNCLSVAGFDNMHAVCSMTFSPDERNSIDCSSLHKMNFVCTCCNVLKKTLQQKKSSAMVKIAGTTIFICPKCRKGD